MQINDPAVRAEIERQIASIEAERAEVLAQANQRLAFLSGEATALRGLLEPPAAQEGA